MDLVTSLVGRKVVIVAPQVTVGCVVNNNKDLSHLMGKVVVVETAHVRYQEVIYTVAVDNVLVEAIWAMLNLYQDPPWHPSGPGRDKI